MKAEVKNTKHVGIIVSLNRFNTNKWSSLTVGTIDNLREVKKEIDKYLKDEEK